MNSVEVVELEELNDISQIIDFNKNIVVVWIVSNPAVLILINFANIFFVLKIVMVMKSLFL